MAGGRFVRWRLLELVFVFCMLYNFAPGMVCDADFYEAGGALPWWAGFSSWLFPVLQVFGVVVTGCLAAWEGLFDNLGSFFSLRRAAVVGNLVFVLVFLVAAFVLEYFGVAGLYHLKGTTGTQNQASLDLFLATLPPWYGLIMVCLVGPFCEELVFRACLYRLFVSRWLALAVSAVVFAWIHTGFSVEILVYLPYGVCFGLAYQRRQRLLDSFLVHSAVNLLMSLVVPWTLFSGFFNSFFHLLY